jgi:hypothetical protein
MGVTVFRLYARIFLNLLENAGLQIHVTVDSESVSAL